MGLELMDVVYPSMRWRHRTARNDQLMDFLQWTGLLSGMGVLALSLYVGLQAAGSD
jgi:hypothetical protein